MEASEQSSAGKPRRRRRLVTATLAFLIVVGGAAFVAWELLGFGYLDSGGETTPLNAFYVHNPIDAPVVVKVGRQRLELEPWSSQRLRIRPGTHAVSVWRPDYMGETLLYEDTIEIGNAGLHVYDVFGVGSYRETHIDTPPEWGGEQQTSVFGGSTLHVRPRVHYFDGGPRDRGRTGFVVFMPRSDRLVLDASADFDEQRFQRAKAALLAFPEDETQQRELADYLYVVAHKRGWRFVLETLESFTSSLPPPSGSDLYVIRSVSRTLGEVLENDPEYVNALEPWHDDSRAFAKLIGLEVEQRAVWAVLSPRKQELLLADEAAFEQVLAQPLELVERYLGMESALGIERYALLHGFEPEAIERLAASAAPYREALLQVLIEFAAELTTRQPYGLTEAGQTLLRTFVDEAETWQGRLGHRRKLPLMRAVGLDEPAGIRALIAELRPEEYESLRPILALRRDFAALVELPREVHTLAARVADAGGSANTLYSEFAAYPEAYRAALLRAFPHDEAWSLPSRPSFSPTIPEAALQVLAEVDGPFVRQMLIEDARRFNESSRHFRYGWLAELDDADKAWLGTLSAETVRAWLSLSHIYDRPLLELEAPLRNAALGLLADDAREARRILGLPLAERRAALEQRIGEAE